MINLLICDDDPKVTDQIFHLVKDFENSNEVDLSIDIKNASTDVDLKNNKYDIAIVDVEMPNKTGLALAQAIRDSNEDAIIIVITSHMCYLDSAMDI